MTHGRTARRREAQEDQQYDAIHRANRLSLSHSRQMLIPLRRLRTWCISEEDVSINSSSPFVSRSTGAVGSILSEMKGVNLKGTEDDPFPLFNKDCTGFVYETGSRLVQRDDVRLVCEFSKQENFYELHFLDKRMILPCVSLESLVDFNAVPLPRLLIYSHSRVQCTRTTSG